MPAEVRGAERNRADAVAGVRTGAARCSRDSDAVTSWAAGQDRFLGVNPVGWDDPRMAGVSDGFREDWRRLWRVAERVGAASGAEPGSVFGDLGLFLDDPDAPDRFGGYVNSPLNTATFASTGGDGVHFGVVFDQVDGMSAVVMTVPMQFDDPNHVVAAGLPEFLALGCITGFNTLELLAYEHSRAEALEDLQNQRSRLDPEVAVLLRGLIEEFDLEPWPDVEGRLDELEAQYGQSLIVDYAWDEPLANGQRVHEILMARQAAYDDAFRSRNG